MGIVGIGIDYYCPVSVDEETEAQSVEVSSPWLPNQ